MKKTFLIIALLIATAFAFISCEKDSNLDPSGGTENAGEPANPGEQDEPFEYRGGFDSIGASNMVFSISATKQVRFSKGNLQYQASTGIWRFAENQFDFIGEENRYISSTFGGCIDLFGWGTSGWSYQPYSTTGGYYGSADISLIYEYAYADWGVYNPISNGGNEAGMWRTLSSSEWSYLIGHSDTRDGKSCLGRIEGFYNGLILLPDDWECPPDLSIKLSASSYYDNKYSLQEWRVMEAAGAIFLPAAGWRQSNRNVGLINSCGNYWSTTNADKYNSSSLNFNGNMSYPARILNADKNYGLSVRLVMDVK